MSDSLTFSAAANSHTIALWHTPPDQAAGTSAENDPIAGTGSDKLAERTRVQISQEALDKFQAYTETAKPAVRPAFLRA